ncbi:MAG: hypothetical protein A3K19_11360 [Lentisphaerae bacterium RIFOXYB12_FULL_65_16]|nr:MAG: hypothetical protein A3K18_25070 [Lentisphaerae bacterium RIFOXYA12_64_32]OGV90165.1 MAG: hypothetical protein A3K19_11360 [Lentisphaerae bacterium RIFOXYB12_FULL_65_16]
MKNHLTRNALRLPAVLTLAAAFAAPWTGAAPAAKPETAKAAPAPQVKTLTPDDVTRDLVTRLQGAKMPWQFYQQYVQTYTGYATEWRAKITDKTPEPTARRYQAMAEYYEDIAKTLEGMTGVQKTMDQIRLNNGTTVPLDKKSDTFAQARDDHENMTAALIQKLRTPPGRVKKN